MSSIYGKVGEQSEGRQNAVPMRAVGEFYGLVERTKIVQSAEKGTFAIVESEVAQVHSGDYTKGMMVCHMQAKGKHTMMEDMIASYVAIYNDVKKGHKFSDNDEENNKIWIEKSEALFGKAVANPETQTWEFVHDNIMKGAVIHYKVVPDPGFKKVDGKKVPKLDAEGNQIMYSKILVLGMVPPENLSEEFKAEFAERLHPAYKNA